MPVPMVNIGKMVVAVPDVFMRLGVLKIEGAVVMRVFMFFGQMQPDANPH